MKTTITLLALFTATILFGQEAGKTGELLKNEISSNSTTRYQESSTRSNTNSNTSNRGDQNDNSSSRQSSRSNKSNRETKKRYQWNQNYGYAEVFVRIPEGGQFTVEIGSQSMTNQSGKFRFFDLNSGSMSISIYEDGYLQYRSQIQVRNDSRLVLDYFSNYGLYLLDSYAVKGQQYGFNQWDDVWNNPYGNESWESGNSNTQTMDQLSFDRFVKNLKKTATFDKDKLTVIKQQAQVSLFTAQQIKTLLKTFSFDDQKVEAGKILFPRCTDKVNFYIVYDSFTFETGKKQLMNYITNLR